MSEQNDGGPAFPVPDFVDPDLEARLRGMSLRDWFAGQVLPALLASKNPITWGGEYIRTSKDFSEAAYDFADAMLATRSSLPATHPK